MNCTEFSNLLDAWLEGTLPPEEAAQMQAHAAACPDCGLLLKIHQDCLQSDGNIEVPEVFSSAWRQKVREESDMEEQKEISKTAGKRKAWKGWIAAAAALVFVVGGTLMTREDRGRYAVSSTTTVAYKSADSGARNGVYALGSAYRAPEAPMEYADYDMAYAAEEEPEAGAEENARTEKIIRSASFTIRTTAYEEDLQSIQDLTARMGGRVEYLSASGDASSGQTRSASLTLRVPAEKLDDFLAGAQGIGSVTALTQEMQDVSDSYYDIQSRLDTQKEKLARLQSMIASAEEVSDLIEIESAIADAQYAIDRYTSQLKGYDSKVDYSTVRVSLREIRVEEAQEISLGQRIWAGLESSLEDGVIFLQDMLIFLVSALPWLVAVGIVVIVIVVICRRRRKTK